MGWIQPHLFGVQVFSLYAARLCLDAAGHTCRVFRDRNYRYRRRPDSPIPQRPAEMAVAGLLRLIRRQSTDVAGPHLVARRACRGADGGLGYSGWHPAKAWRLWLCPLLLADVSP